MINITKLANKWRDDDYWDFNSLFPVRRCAADLEAALPVWVEITDNPGTWPEIDVRVMLWHRGDFQKISSRARREISIEYKYGDISVYAQWRPLTDLDYPPGVNHEQTRLEQSA